VINKELGKQGEAMACLLLKRQGFSILCRNYANRIGEIDVIAKKGNTLVFCEVKTRNNTNYGQPFEAVSSHKQKTINRLALMFLQRHPELLDYEIRFDVVSILFNGKKHNIFHIENAF